MSAQHQSTSASAAFSAQRDDAVRWIAYQFMRLAVSKVSSCDRRLLAATNRACQWPVSARDLYPMSLPCPASAGAFGCWNNICIKTCTSSHTAAPLLIFRQAGAAKPPPSGVSSPPTAPGMWSACRIDPLPFVRVHGTRQRVSAAGKPCKT